jgi:uncharacterized protein
LGEDICGYKSQAFVTIKTKAGENKVFEVGIADIPLKYEKGLMNCKELQSGKGLFFIFKDDRPRYFWMKNTLIPLAIIYLDKDFKVVLTGKGVPLSQKTVPSINAARYVLEVNFEEGQNIQSGDKALFKMK